jgi:hypothetical protein
MSEHEVNDDDEIGNRVEWKYNGTRKARGGKIVVQSLRRRRRRPCVDEVILMQTTQMRTS